MKKAVIYARYSSDVQKETSITDQLRDCHEYAVKNGYEIVHEYCDEAVSGKSDEREQFQQMLTDSAKEIFETVIVWKLDRFARNRNESAINKVKLKKNGVNVISAMEHIPEGPEGIILESLLEGMAEYYVYDLVEKTSRGRRGIALQAKHTGGRPLLGYKVNPDKTYAVDEYNADTVRQIFRMYAEGHSFSEIIDAMNAQGRKTAAGKPFGKNSIHELLRNERYIGTYTYNKIPSKNGKRNSHGSKVDDKVIRIPHGMPAIIDMGDWQRVQSRMDKNKKAPAAHKAKISYLLSGKLFCGECGGAMVGQSSGSHTKYGYYECSTKKRVRTCKKQNVKKELIENAVVDYTVKYVLSDEVCDTLATLAHEEAVKDSSNQELVAAVTKKQKKNQTEIDNILKAIKLGIITDSTKEELDKLEAEKRALSEQRDQLEFFQSSVRSKEAISAWLHRFIDGDVTDPEFRQQLVNSFVNAVYVYDNGTVVIIYNWDGDGQKHKINLTDLDGVLSSAPNNPKLFTLKNSFGILFVLPLLNVQRQK